MPGELGGSALFCGRRLPNRGGGDTVGAGDAVGAGDTVRALPALGWGSPRAAGVSPGRGAGLGPARGSVCSYP